GAEVGVPGGTPRRGAAVVPTQLAAGRAGRLVRLAARAAVARLAERVPARGTRAVLAAPVTADLAAGLRLEPSWPRGEGRRHEQEGAQARGAARHRRASSAGGDDRRAGEVSGPGTIVMCRLTCSRTWPSMRRAASTPTRLCRDRMTLRTRSSFARCSSTS